MGMFTTIIHPIDGRELQIKCGEDLCKVYKIGDTVDWYVIEDWPNSGYLLDDVYPSYSCNGPDDWVIIKDHVVLTTEKWNPDDQSYYALAEKYNVQPPAKELWSEEAWKKYEIFQKEIQDEFDAFNKSIDGLSKEDQRKALILRPLTRRMNYSELAESIIKIEPLPPGAISYDKK